jgi:hypothetical protein
MVIALSCKVHEFDAATSHVLNDTDVLATKFRTSQQIARENNDKLQAGFSGWTVRGSEHEHAAGSLRIRVSAVHVFACIRHKRLPAGAG